MKGTFEIQIDDLYILSYLNNGVQLNPKYNGDLDAYALNMKKRGWNTWNGDGMLHCEVHELNIQEFELIMSLDHGEVFRFMPTVKILRTDINNTIDPNLPNAYYPSYENLEDIDNKVIIPAKLKTWNEWLLNLSREGSYGGYACTEVDEYNYYNVIGVYKGVQYMTGTELSLIHNHEDVVLVESAPTTEVI